MLFMVIERFRNREDAKAVYRRFRDQGRGAAAGLSYVGSWIEANFDRCFQIMECDDARLLQQWVAFWSDLVEFEIVPVVPSADTRAMIEPLLEAGREAQSS
jgi:2-hydroxy-3-keto-5-methylthiopentenyl-1-phosphate phosphatase